MRSSRINTQSIHIQLSSAVSSLANSLDDPAVPASASQQHALQRHREILLDFERDYRRSRASVKQARDRHDLLGSVKVDIECVPFGMTLSSTSADILCVIQESQSTTGWRCRILARRTIQTGQFT